MDGCQKDVAGSKQLQSPDKTKEMGAVRRNSNREGGEEGTKRNKESISGTATGKRRSSLVKLRHNYSEIKDPQWLCMVTALGKPTYQIVR